VEVLALNLNLMFVMRPFLIVVPMLLAVEACLEIGAWCRSDSGLEFGTCCAGLECVDNSGYYNCQTGGGGAMFVDPEDSDDDDDSSTDAPVAAPTSMCNSDAQTKRSCKAMNGCRWVASTCVEEGACAGNRKTCNKLEGCKYSAKAKQCLKEVVAEGCTDVTSARDCRKRDECTWTGSKSGLCLDNEDATSDCTKGKNNKACRKLAGCAWNKTNKSCIAA